MREEARCVIVGGGAMGVGLLYHLAHEGWTDTVLIEKGELTSGSTWHAAGLVPNFIGDLNMAKVHQEAISLYPKIEEETGLSSGWHGCGAIRLAISDEDVLWHRQVHAQLNQLGIESHIISPREIRELNPLFENIDDVQTGFYTPNDGWADPTGVTNTMAKGARQLGCEVVRHNRVTDMSQLPNGNWEVITEKGKIVCEHVVNAAGCYSPQLGAMVGLDVPIVSVIHQYIVTEPLAAMKALDFEPPVTRDPISSSYYRREIDGLLIGPYETANAQAYGVDDIDWKLDFHLTPPDVDNIADCLTLALDRVPAWAEAGIKTIVSGPITHTPDSGYLMGPAPGLRNYWHCGGASIGITQGPGAGKYLAQWMVHGQTEINVRGMDPRRFGDHTGPKGVFAFEKAIEEYHLMYATRPPGENHPAARKQKVTPIHDRLDALGAQWQEVYGWERPQYFGEPERHSFLRSNAFAVVGEEVRGVRERVGIADLTAFAKFEVNGADAAALLDRLSANKLPGKIGGIRLVHMLTELGGIECEMTITRLGDDRFYLNSAIMGTTHDEDWLNDHMNPGEDVSVADVTDQLGLLALTGPRARDVLSQLTDVDLTAPAFRWLTAQEIEVAGVPCKALRVSYVGELGWELHHPIERMSELYDAIISAGEPHGLVHFGAYAMNAMRIEKGYKAWGSELTTEITPIEARLERFVDFDGDFIGKEATIARRDQAEPLSTVLVYCEIEEGPSDLLGNEPAYGRDGTVMGIGTSGAFGHAVGKSLGFVYVAPDYEAPGSTFELEMLGLRRTATVLAEPAYDAANAALRAEEAAMTDEPRRRRTGGRAGRMADRAAPVEIEDRPVRPGLPGGRYQPLTERDLQMVYDTSLWLLENVGMGSPVPEFIQVVTEGGGRMDGDRLYFPRHLVEGAIATANKGWTWHGYDDDRSIEVGGDRVHFGTAGAAVLMHDHETNTFRHSTAQDVYDCARLVDRLDNIHFFVRTVVARDEADSRLLDLNTAYGATIGTGKPVGTSWFERAHVYETVEMYDMLAGGDGEFRKRPFVAANNTFVVPPLRFAEESTNCMVAQVETGMPINLLSAGQAGATSPAALAGSLAQALAECLSALTAVNLMSPGHPCVMGLWPFVSDLRTGAMSGGSGEEGVLNAAAAQLTNWLGLPSGVAAGMSDSKIPDNQAGYEKGINVALAGHAGANLVYESAGMLGSLLACSLEALVIDNDMLGSINRTVRGIEVNEETLSTQVIAEVIAGPGHFLGSQQTLELMQKEYIYPEIGDRDTPDNWLDAGGKSAADVAHEYALDVLAKHHPSHVPAERDEMVRERWGISIER